jgi:hypothetical protein
MVRLHHHAKLTDFRIFVYRCSETEHRSSIMGGQKAFSHFGETSLRRNWAEAKDVTKWRICDTHQRDMNAT